MITPSSGLCWSNGAGLQDLFQEFLRDFTRDGSAEGAQFAAGDDDVRSGIDCGVDVLRQHIVMNFEDQVRNLGVSRDDETQLRKLRALLKFLFDN